MYKYTPSIAICKQLTRIKKYDHAYNFCCSFFPSKKNYTEAMTMQKYFANNAEFHSATKVKCVPIMGTLFPVEMFDVEVI